MKKITTLAIALSTVLVSINENKIQAQSFDKGKFVGTVGYGISAIFGKWKRLIDATYAGGTGTSKASAFGPLLIKGDYGISDKIGVGGVIGYGRMKHEYTYESTVVIPTPPYTKKETYTDTWKLSAIIIAVRGTYHFVNKDNLDVYGGVEGVQESCLLNGNPQLPIILHSQQSLVVVHIMD